MPAQVDQTASINDSSIQHTAYGIRHTDYGVQLQPTGADGPRGKAGQGRCPTCSQSSLLPKQPPSRSNRIGRNVPIPVVILTSACILSPPTYVVFYIARLRETRVPKHKNANGRRHQPPNTQLYIHCRSLQQQQQPPPRRVVSTVFRLSHPSFSTTQHRKSTQLSQPCPKVISPPRPSANPASSCTSRLPRDSALPKWATRAKRSRRKSRYGEASPGKLHVAPETEAVAKYLQNLESNPKGPLDHHLKDKFQKGEGNSVGASVQK